MPNINSDAKKLAEEMVKNLSVNDIVEIKAKLEGEIATFLIEKKQALDNLVAQKNDLQQQIYATGDKQRATNDYTVKMQLSEQIQSLSAQIKNLEIPILTLTNTVNCIANGGDIVNFTDKKGVNFTEIPVFSKIEANLILFDEETILSDPLPSYIPVINEDVFRQKGYVFDVIRIKEDTYLLSVNGFNNDEPLQNSLAVVSLDQLVLINNYYFIKAKATIEKSAAERDLRLEESYLKLPIERREKHFNQPNYYKSLPSAVKKKVTATEWDNLTLTQKEEFYKPIKYTTRKRLVSKLDETSMWASYHHMYERFIDPKAIQPKPGYANHQVFVYWTTFRDMMKWKIKDLEIQRQTTSEIRKIALETSFGSSNTNNSLQEQYGILVKRQDGSNIGPDDIEQIKNAWILVQSKFGNLKDVATTDALKISHTGQKYVFASKASGVYVQDMSTIAVSNKFGNNQFMSILAHEVAHYIDHKLGVTQSRRHITDNFESTAGKLAFAFRKNMNEVSDSDYTNATAECFARAMEQFFAIEQFGIDAALTSTNPETFGFFMKYITEKNYVSLQNYQDIIKPLILNFLSENADFFNQTPIASTDAIIIPEKENVATEFTIQETDKPKTDQPTINQIEMEKPKYSVNQKVYMFKDEPTLIVKKVYEWADKPATYDLQSEDGEIARGNIAEEKIFLADNDIGVNDEGMWHGGERRVKSFDYLGNVIIISLDEEGNEVGEEIKVSLGAFKKEFSKFPKKELSARAEDILSKALTQYESSAEKEKHQLIKQVSDNLEREKLGENIGFGLDKDMVAAGKSFLKQVNPIFAEKDVLSIALQDVITHHPTRKFGNLDLAEAKLLYSIQNVNEISDDFVDNITLKDAILKSLEDMGYLEIIDAYRYKLSDQATEFITAVNNRVETIKSVQSGTNLFPEETNIYLSNPETVYNDIKSCLIEEGDDESLFIFEGKQFTINDDGKNETWQFVSFFKYGAVVEHVIKTKLSTKKPNVSLTFDELVKMEQAADIHIDGITNVTKLNHCLRLLKKCIDIIDLKTELEKTKEFAKTQVDINKSLLDIKKPKQQVAPKEAKLTIAATQDVSQIAEITEAIGYITEALPDLKGKDKKEAKYALEVCNELLSDLKANQLKQGIDVEQEHKDMLEKIAAGKIDVKQAVKETAQEHINEDPDYYTKLAKI